MKVLICISNKILGRGLERVLQDLCVEDVIHASSHGGVNWEPDIVLFNSSGEIISLKQLYNKAKFIYVDLGLADSDILSLLCAYGVSGVISPSLEVENLPKALKKVKKGEVWLDQQYLHLLLHDRMNNSANINFHQLSAQDRHIIDLVANGHTNQEIANDLCLSLPTIKAHLTKIFKQLHINNRAQLAALASKNLNLDHL